eukprot:TRINITY_DN43941_c0_g1_i1.p1 TRINITY_DN43941_c0_g1~~TRINITY_DN43941_c0_g1_i1.p1  ORF type:complete len:243 (-),score=65.62 TRINITY_DN43941_c0_g1_i1:435-1163(-)
MACLRKLRSFPIACVGMLLLWCLRRGAEERQPAAASVESSSGMPGQAPVRFRPLSGELEPSSDEGAWLPDPLAYAAATAAARGGSDATEARLFAWEELFGNWMEHLMTAIDLAVLGERVPTVVGVVDRNDAESLKQVKALRRFKCAVKDGVRVFVLFTHEFEWLMETWEIEELPTLLLFGTGGAETRSVVPGPLLPSELAEILLRQLAVDLSRVKFIDEEDDASKGSLLRRLWAQYLKLLKG